MGRKITGNRSRTTNTVLNFTSSVGGQLLTILLQFIVRTVFISTLGKVYLGINGLFSNILGMLSLAELGVGSAILFKLYDPISRKNHERIATLMKFYKTVYRYIGIVIFGAGLCLIPFLPHLVKGYEKLDALNINAAFIFVLYLMQSASSYFFFAYKSAIIRADQKEYTINIIQYFTNIVASLIQIAALYAFGNFTVYVVILIGQTILQNLLTALLANRFYPFIKTPPKENLSRNEAKEIFKDCGALFLYRLNGVVLKATDNIVLSAFAGIEMVGLYSNYYIFYTTINSMFSRVFGSVSHSLGNLHTTHDNEHEYQIFEVINLVSAILGGTAFVGIFCVADEFVGTWVGKDWVISQPFSFLMGFELYTLASRVSLSKYRTTMGLFQQAKWRPLAGMIINLVVSVALVNVWGICGVLVGTLVADWTTFMWFDPLIIHKYGFENYKPVTSYYKRLAKYTAVVLTTGLADRFICKFFFAGHGWASVLVHSLICAVTVPGVLIAIMSGKQEGKYVILLMKNALTKIRKKIHI